MNKNESQSKAQSAKRWWRRRWVWVSGAVLTLLLALALAVFSYPEYVLCVESGTVKADVMVVLGGAPHERPARAAELFHEGAAPGIIFSGSGDGEANRRMLLEKGVPEAAITVEDQSRSTMENAAHTVPLLRARGAKRVIIVTSWFHSRRALQCFRKAAPEIQFYSRPAYLGYARSEWKRHRVPSCVRSEYLKLCGYWVRHGVMPF